ncbi:MAG: FliM/FliN family flagellar motor switch protein [Phycisphaerales bacterium]
MPAELKAIMKLEVPLIVEIGRRKMTVAAVTSLAPGSIIELPKPAEDELEILVNNKTVGTGVGVKVGENFGVKVAFIGDLKQRILALGAQKQAAPEGKTDDEAAALAEALLAGQN